MRRFMLLALLAVIAVAMVGCGGKELTDETYPEVYVATWNLTDDAEIAGILEDYSSTPAEFEAYTDGIVDSSKRFGKMTAAITELDAAAGIAFAALAVTEIAFDDLGELLSEGLGEANELMGELGEALGEGMAGLATGLEGLAEGIESGLEGLGDEETTEEEVTVEDAQ
ncbi:hypothetical protein K8R78_01655 [bacterium]|nr:hypothetical protein [bacterium]